MIQIDPNRKHKAIPTGELRIDATGHTVADCRWCGREISQTHSHVGQSNAWRHAAGTFK